MAYAASPKIVQDEIEGARSTCRGRVQRAGCPGLPIKVGLLAESQT